MESATERSPVNRELTDVTQAEIHAVEIALSKIDQANLAKLLISAVSNWTLVLKMFRDVEIGYVSLRDRKPLEGKYRGLLASLMGFGELIMETANGLPNLDLRGTGMTRSDLDSNVRYLREKYEQWFVKVEDCDGEEILRRLENECSAST